MNIRGLYMAARSLCLSQNTSLAAVASLEAPAAHSQSRPGIAQREQNFPDENPFSFARKIIPIKFFAPGFVFAFAGSFPNSAPMTARVVFCMNNGLRLLILL